MDTIRATPVERPGLNAIAALLRALRSGADAVKIPKPIGLTEPMGGGAMQYYQPELGSMLLGRAPEALERIAYGDYPMAMPQGSHIPITKAGRGQDLVDLAGITPMVNPAKLAQSGMGRGVLAMIAGGDVPGMAGVIKNKGGNWLSHSVEGMLEQFHRGRLPDKNYYSDRVWAELPDEVRAGIKGFDYENVPQTHPAEWNAAWNRLYGNHPDTLLNQWIDKQLTRYVKNEMATPEDPVRALAERGVLHADLAPGGWADNDYGYHLGRKRESVGMPAETTAVSELARKWENIADDAIDPLRAFAYQEEPRWQVTGTFPQKFNDKTEAQRYIDNLQTGAQNLTAPDKNAIMEALKKHPLGIEETYTWKRNPWLEKVPPDTPIHSLSSGDTVDNLGFSHLLDEMRNTLGTDLPEQFRWRPEDLPKVSVPQAVQRVHDINQWRAAQKAEADALKARNPATVMHKDYPDAPYAWMELKQPEVPAVHPDDLVGRELSDYIQYEASGYSPEEALKKAISDRPRKILQDALTYEGNTMGHCVGGYCNDVLSGNTRIFSLRDKKTGEPHVTIEVAEPKSYSEWEGYGRDPAGIVPADVQDKLYGDAVAEAKKVLGDNPDSMELDEITSDIIHEKMQDWMANNAPPPEIVQIKGKQNAAPVGEYLPYVQDFVRSKEWRDVGDLQNTGLIDIASKGIPEGILKRFGFEGQRYVPKDAYTKMVEYNATPELPPAPEMRKGGVVNIHELARKYAAGGAVNAYADSIAAARAAAQSGNELAYLAAVQNARGAPDATPEQWAKDIAELNGLRNNQVNQAAATAYGNQVSSGPKGADGQTAGQRGYYLDQADKDAQIAYLKSQGRAVQTDYGLNFDNLMFKKEWDALQASRNAQAQAGIVAGGTPITTRPAGSTSKPTGAATPSWLKGPVGMPGGMAEGGLVQYDPAQVESIAAQLRKEFQ